MTNPRLFKCILPTLAIAAALATAYICEDSPLHPKSDTPYFAFVLLAAGAAAVLLFVLSVGNAQIRERYAQKTPFFTGVILFLLILNLLTVKTATLPVLYFPSLDRIFGVLISDRGFIATCLLYSLRLLLVGWAAGAVAGIATGVAIGFSSHVRYWIYPLVRILGPIPSTAWIPLVLIAFPSVISASTFLIALAVWFPTTILTSSGISSIQNAYFEAAATLGATKRYSIFHVGIPAALPHMYIGLFNGTTASFITLVTGIGIKGVHKTFTNAQDETVQALYTAAGMYSRFKKELNIK